MTIGGLPSRLLESSAGLGWRSVTVRSYADPPVAGPFTTRSSDLLVVLVTAGRYRIESRHGRAWHGADYRPGSLGITAPGNESVLRWRSTGGATMRSLHLHVDPALVPDGTRFPDSLSVDDPFVTTSARALHDALRDGAPDLYADAVAEAMVAHLAYRTGSAAARPGPRLGRRDLDAVTAYMRANLANDLALADLGGLVNLSRYHFLRAFSASTGLTPHRFLTRLRMQAAEALLRGTDHSVLQVALACGYRSAGRFATAFRREYGSSPSAYRRRA
ncbi:AraC family transcriptional regulator [Virgisporangium ochraceum]